MMITNPLITSRRRIAFQARFVRHRHRYQRNGRSDANVAPIRAHSGTSKNNNNADDADENASQEIGADTRRCVDECIERVEFVYI